MQILFSSEGFLFGATTIEDGNLLNAGTAAYAARCLTMLHRDFPDISRAVVARTVHGSRVTTVRRESPSIILETDGLVTNESGIALCVTGADCAPVFFADPVRQVIALAHSGRRGTQANIVTQTISAMRETFGSHAAHLQIMIGPSICATHYKVSQEISISFYDAYPSRSAQSHLDLPGIIYDQLVASSVRSDHILSPSECTFEHPEKWFSHRRDVSQGIDGLRVQLFFAVKRQMR